MLQALVLRYASSETRDFAPWLVAWTLSFLGFEKDCCPCFLWNKTILINNINIDSGNASGTSFKHTSRDVMRSYCGGHLRLACRYHSSRLLGDMPMSATCWVAILAHAQPYAFLALRCQVQPTFVRQFICSTASVLFMIMT
ncbi:hypothetical protein H9L39_10083 [Fusarium oxysporum f. sp. albedinis]|nr:hypothetical protein H9L39_10083 [Fusarium oxysporum f. sp. albedinis]